MSSETKGIQTNTVLLTKSELEKTVSERMNFFVAFPEDPSANVLHHRKPDVLEQKENSCEK